MRNTFFLLGAAGLAALLCVGCAGPEAKLGRGMANASEIFRMNEMHRSVEQDGLFYGPVDGVATGVVQGVDKTLARTGVGIYEVLTYPFPPYHPVWTSYLTPSPSFPDAYAPRLWDEPVFNTDMSLGFSGGAIAPWFPGSRFTVFDN